MTVDRRTGASEPAHYRLHLFCCTNERSEDHPRGSCGRKGSAAIRTYMARKARELGVENVRVNAAGCLDRCELGPVVVVYPQGVWYRVETTEDADEIVQRHLIEGVPVERLMIDR
jgi:(2Fe-2S) ferredoxin